MLKIDKTPWRVYDSGHKSHYPGLESQESSIVVFGDGDDLQGIQGKEDNAQAIVNAVNGTYGVGIDPLYVTQICEALKNFVDWCEENSMWDKVGQSYYKAKQVLYKSKIY
jgi:hypothetical protein